MASVATSDTDVGNVFAGAGGALKITAILFGTHLSPVPIGGAHIAGDHGVLYIEPRGSYRYARISNLAATVDLANAVDRFKYQVVNGSGMATVGNLEFQAGPELPAVLGMAAPAIADIVETEIVAAVAWA